MALRLRCICCLNHSKHPLRSPSRSPLLSAPLPLPLPSPLIPTPHPTTPPTPNRSGLAEPFPSPITLQDALTHFADLLSSPHKENLAALAAAATDEADRARLALLASPAGKAEYQEYVVKQHRSLLEVRGGWLVFFGGGALGDVCLCAE